MKISFIIWGTFLQPWHRFPSLYEGLSNNLGRDFLHNLGDLPATLVEILFVISGTPGHKNFHVFVVENKL
jgi:hypothetical protein